MIDIVGVQGQREYLSYLLRLWRADAEGTSWRASLESVASGETVSFATLHLLWDYLLGETADGAAVNDRPAESESRV
jgi:hypothetical protein